VLTTPVIRCIRNRYPEAEIHYATKRAFKGILENNPYINRLHILEDDLQALITELSIEKFDAIIDLHHNLRTLRIKKALRKVKSYSFNKLNVEKWVYTNFKINTMPDVHIVDRYMETVKDLGVFNDGLGLDYFIPDTDVVKQSDLPMSHIAGYIAVVIGAAHATKKLPVEKLKELCQKIEYPLVLVGGKEDFDNGRQIAAIDDVKVYNSCGKFNLNESADIVRKAKLVISHDTGFMHIASAFKKNILAIWGNTVPSFGMTPYQTFFENFQVKKLWCRPCSKIGYKRCPLGHFKCMNKQPIDAIVSRVNAFLK
jgi:ADP-heptose:LPS heptosyltransferase